MSSSVKRRPKSHVEGLGNEEDHGDDDAEEDEIIEEKKSKGMFGKKKKKNRIRANMVVLIQPLKKFKKLILTRNGNRSSSSSCLSSSKGDRRGADSRNWVGRLGNSCCLCLSVPQTVDDDVGVGMCMGGKKGDPDDPETSFEALRVLIEKNDFFAKECNTHLSD